MATSSSLSETVPALEATDEAVLAQTEVCAFYAFERAALKRAARIQTLKYTAAKDVLLHLMKPHSRGYAQYAAACKLNYENDKQWRFKARAPTLPYASRSSVGSQ